MAVYAVESPMTMEFGEHLAVEKDGWFYCHKKNVKVLTDALLTGIKIIAKDPLRTKVLVGCTIQNVPWNGGDKFDDPNNVYLWRDENKTHIGCLWEYTTEFNRKYLQLVKQLNSK